MSDALRAQLSQDLLGQPFDNLTPIQRSVIDLIATEAPSKEHPAIAPDDRSFWERMADRVAAVGGSWNFIFGFGLVLLLWIGSNLFLAATHAAFDPYPFIFLNLILSMLAAIQAPVIMMSQNRAAERDREAAEHDYVVNLRAELEIMRLHDKLDAVRDGELMEMVRCQNETLEILRKQVTELSGDRSA